MQTLPCIGELYHRFKQNVPESELRQFDRLQLRLLLLAGDSDSDSAPLPTAMRFYALQVEYIASAYHFFTSQ